MILVSLVPCTTPGFGYECAGQYICDSCKFSAEISPVLIPQNITKRCESDFVEGEKGIDSIIGKTLPLNK